MTNRVSHKLYEKMPSNVVEFVQANAMTDYLVEVNGEIIMDIWLKGELVEATLYFNKQRTSIVSRTVCIVDIETLRDNYLLNSNQIDKKQGSQLVEEFEALFLNLRKTVEDAGYRLGCSHNVGDGLYAYWDVMMTEETFDGAKFLSIWQLFIDFDKKLTQTLDELGFAM